VRRGCVSVCVCVCERERERKKEREVWIRRREEKGGELKYKLPKS